MQIVDATATEPTTDTAVVLTVLPDLAEHLGVEVFDDDLASWAAHVDVRMLGAALDYVGNRLRPHRLRPTVTVVDGDKGRTRIHSDAVTWGDLCSAIILASRDFVRAIWLLEERISSAGHDEVDCLDLDCLSNHLDDLVALAWAKGSDLYRTGLTLRDVGVPPTLIRPTATPPTKRTP